MQKSFVRTLGFPQKHTLLTLAFLVTVFLQCVHPYQQGERLYTANCQRCHGKSGEGFENLYPSLVQSTFIHKNKEHLPCIIAHGSHYLSQVNGSGISNAMPENPHLSAIEILNIINYLNHKFETGNTATISEVENALERCSH